MSIMGRRIPSFALTLAALAMFVLALMPVMTEAPAPRQITLVARNMAFYLEGDPATPNPTIDLVAGERVTIVLRNEEEGMVHDLVVAGLPIRIDTLRWREQRDLTLTVPDAPGTYSYVCQPHKVMMHGRVRITPVAD
jgi:plastocyanin